MIFDNYEKYTREELVAKCRGHVRARSEQENEIEWLQAALSSLIDASRGMPTSHDNLCQTTLDVAIDEADQILSGNGDKTNG